MLKNTVIYVLFVLPVASTVTAQARKTVECYCTDKSGARVEMGQARCLSVGGRIFMARCEMSLNVPMWRDMNVGCASS